MKIKTIFFLIILLSFSSGRLLAQMTEREREVIAEINSVRKDPKSYIKYVDEYLKSFNATTEEIQLAKELKKELSEMKPVPSLTFSKELYTSAKKHADYVKRTKKFEHSDCNCAENIQYGVNNPRFAVIDLLIDAGIPDRAHRKNILNPQYKYVAVYEIVDGLNEMPYFFIQQFNIVP